MATRIGIDDAIETLLAETTRSAKLREQGSLAELLAQCNGRVVIFGGGNNGRRVAACLRSLGVEPLAIADNNTQLEGVEHDGFRILPAREAAECYGDNALFIVAIWNPFHWFSETLAQLKALGCQNIASMGAVYWRFPEVFLPFYCQDLPHKVLEEREDVVLASSLWADEQSNVEYRSHVRWRVRGDYANLPMRSLKEPYFDEDIVELSYDESIVDGGAFDGDTVRSFLGRRGGDFRRIDAIEPSPDSVERLRSYVATLPPEWQQKIAVHQVAVGVDRGCVRFDARLGLGAHLSESGSVVVRLAKLDDLCRATDPSFMKLDIEGAEYDALLGARKVLEKRQPVLAVCAYHTQNHLWRLPLLIRQMLPEHRLFLRTYEGDGFQAVVYAVPEQRVIRRTASP